MKSWSFEIRRDKTEYCKKKIEIYIYIYICFYLFSNSILKSLFAFAEAKRQELVMAWRTFLESTLCVFLFLWCFLSLWPLYFRHFCHLTLTFVCNQGKFLLWLLARVTAEWLCEWISKSPSQTKQLLTDVELNIIKLIFLWRKRKLFLKGYISFSILII